MKDLYEGKLMSRERVPQTLKLRLLALALALALVWYSLNPAPRSVIRKKREAEPPDEKNRNVEPQRMPTIPLIALRRSGETIEPLPSNAADEDDFEWPEFIDG